MLAVAGYLLGILALGWLVILAVAVILDDSSLAETRQRHRDLDVRSYERRVRRDYDRAYRALMREFDRLDGRR